MKPRLLELAACQGGATKGYQDAGWHVTAVDLDAKALERNPADVHVQNDALWYLEHYGQNYDAIHASFPCQRWAANGVVKNKDWPDLITPGRELLNATGKPWVMENVDKAPLRRDLELCGCMFNLGAIDADGLPLRLERMRVFESNIPLRAPRLHHHDPEVWVAGVYGGGRRWKKPKGVEMTYAELAPLDRHEARYVRKGGYVPRSAEVQSQLLGGVDWMTWDGRRECIPPVYAEWVGRLLLEHLERDEIGMPDCGDPDCTECSVNDGCTCGECFA